MANYEIIGPNGKITGTASDLKKAQEIAAASTKLSGSKHIVRNTSNIKINNAEILKQIRGIRGGGGMSGPFGLPKNK